MRSASIAPSTATLRLPTPSLLMTTTPVLNGKLRCALRSTRRWKGNGLLYGHGISLEGGRVKERGSRMRSGLYLATMLAASSLAAAETPLTIGQLLAQGWEIAGYASGYDNRTSLILFRHPGVNT